MSFADHFSGVASDYARYRPRYPEALFAFLSSLCARHALAWDCATGSGQAAVPLAEYFERVIATDASRRQIENAQVHPKVAYRVATAEESGLESASVDLATIAQALHWLDLPRFYQEVRSIVVSGGIFAAWSYNRLTIDPAVDKVIGHYYERIVGPYWPPERVLVERGYAGLAFPFDEDEIVTPPFSMAARWDLASLFGYLRTWSATRAFVEATCRDPIDAIRDDLTAAWGDSQSLKEIRWPLALRVGRV